jgi:methionyl-tRNA formyltransferase
MEDIDSGPIYLKTDLDLSGSATEIYRAASDKIFNTLIPTILSSRPVPVAQVGEVVNFTRRKPEESNIAELECIQQVYDYIRMLDAEGYPNAFVQLGNIRYEFSNGSIDGSEVRAEVRIKKVKVSQ